MRIEDWCVHRASCGRFDVSVLDSEISPKWPNGLPRFLYVLHYRRLLVSREEELELLMAGRPVPGVVRVACRRTMREITQLATKWEREAKGNAP